MFRDVKGETGKKTGKRFMISISCLILLSLDLFFLTYAAGLGIGGAGGENERLPFRKSRFLMGNVEDDEDNREMLRKVGGYDNPIDDFYLSALCYGSGTNEYDMLSAYEAAWREQLLNYVKSCGMGYENTAHKKAAEEYMKAVLEAIGAQKNLMEHMGVEKERTIWYSVQIYRHAFVKDIKGKFVDYDGTVIDLNGEGGSLREIPGRVYEVYGEFSNEIDQKFIKALYEENGTTEAGGARELTIKDDIATVKKSLRQEQESFDINWCNELSQLTMEFYGELNEEGKQLVGIWQESRENWKRASSEYLRCMMEEADIEEGDIYSEEEDIFAEMLERDGWINRLYFLQLQSMKKNTYATAQRTCCAERTRAMQHVCMCA
ncbi:hypothetical protein [Parablautia muri]|uniref:Uncharacterized protein n=1 Tax=Parablautia muri TaxID=2320879 RepID=A0A9X5GTX7_9FIRM|nr:hypothetical protein [Parablautia muri]NBJ94629.1 hypothetical protein [Parablautia muri]